MTTMATGSPAANAPTDPYAQFEAGVGALLADDPATWTLQELHDRIEGLHTIMNQVESVSLAALASYDARGGAQIAGHRTTGDWLATTTRTTSASAGWRVHTARALRDYLPHTAQALADGDIDTDHIRAIRRARRILGDDFDRIEETVMKVARTHNITDLRALVDLIIQQYRPEAHDNRAEDDRERRKVDLSPGFENTWILNGILDAATGAALAAAFDVYAAPTGPDDKRSPGQRRADALKEIAERSTDQTDRPTGTGHVTITVTPDQLATGIGAKWPSGLVMSRTDLAVHSCSAKVTLVVGLTTDQIHWQPLAVGYAERYATAAQRAALAVRDGKGCIHPGCTVPAHRCIAHHIRSWADGGPTDLSNLVLICRYHHRRVHLGRLWIVRTAGGRYITTDTRPPPLDTS